MSRLRFYLAVFAAKGVKFLLRLAGRKATTLPGAVALRICPDILAHFGESVRGKVALITGTNGKTTTSNLLARFLRADGCDVVSNSLGANLVQGIVTTLLERFPGKWKQAHAIVLEVDEATIGKVIGPLHPSVVVVNNFFRDQMDRYGEVDTVVSMVGQALNQASADTAIILNADDPLVASIVPQGKKAVWFGINSVEGMTSDLNEVRDGRFCRTCGSSLRYSRYHYGQLGFYHCDHCGFHRPEPDHAAERVRQEGEGIRFVWKEHEGSLSTPGLYNVYNAMAALSAAVAMGVREEVVVHEIAHLSTGLGRMERLQLGEQSVLLSLVKNPTGFNQVLSVVRQEQRPAYILIVLNDRYADGTDVSWIWDTNLEQLQKMPQLKRIWAAGTRAYDMAVRLKYAGFASMTEVKEGDVDVVDSILEDLPSGSLLYILSTYTSLYAIRDHLLAKGKMQVEA